MSAVVSTNTHPDHHHHHHHHSVTMNQQQQQEQPPSHQQHQQLQQQKRNKFFISGAEFNITDRYDPIERVGMGAYGLVISALDRHTNQKVAIKKITNVFNNSCEYQKRILREVASLKYLNGHENIIELIEIIRPENFESFNDVYIVTNYMDTTLKDLLRQQLSANQQNNQQNNDESVVTELSLQHVKWFMYQLLQGLDYMHSHGIVHRDIKPSNILVNRDMELRLCDMGLSREYSFKEETEMTTYVSTRYYRAPELLLKYRRSGPAIDVWSVACIFGEMLNRKVLFPGSTYIQQLELVLDVCGTPSSVEEFSRLKGSPEALRWLKTLKKRQRKDFSRLFPRADADAVDLLDKMLRLDPEQRISVREALNHSFFAEIREANNVSGIGNENGNEHENENYNSNGNSNNSGDSGSCCYDENGRVTDEHMMLGDDEVERLFNIPSVREIKAQMFKLVAAA